MTTTDNGPHEGCIDTQTVGITDRCGVCGRLLNEPGDVGLRGVNAVLCRTCREQSARFSPWWVSVHGERVFDCWIVPCLPESPYWNATANPTFLERADSPFQNGWNMKSGPLGFDELTEAEQEIVCWLSCREVPPGYEVVSHEDLDINYVQTVEPRLTYDISDDGPRRGQLTSDLPERYLIDQGTVYTPGSGDAIRDTLGSGFNAGTQATFG